MTDPAAYHAWYATPRGAWIVGRELTLLDELLRPRPGESVLDVGCGTGYFSSALSDRGLAVTGLDPDLPALRFARQRDPRIAPVKGRAGALPFADGAFDYALAMTSLCFVPSPAQALRELWRVSRRAVLLGLLRTATACCTSPSTGAGATAGPAGTAWARSWIGPRGFWPGMASIPGAQGAAPGRPRRPKSCPAGRCSCREAGPSPGKSSH